MALPMGVLRFGKHIHFTGPAWLATSGKPTQSFAPVPREKNASSLLQVGGDLLALRGLAAPVQAWLGRQGRRDPL